MIMERAFDFVTKLKDSNFYDNFNNILSFLSKNNYLYKITKITRKSIIYKETYNDKIYVIFGDCCTGKTLIIRDRYIYLNSNIIMDQRIINEK